MCESIHCVWTSSRSRNKTNNAQREKPNGAWVPGPMEPASKEEIASANLSALKEPNRFPFQSPLGPPPKMVQKLKRKLPVLDPRKSIFRGQKPEVRQCLTRGDRPKKIAKKSGSTEREKLSKIQRLFLYLYNRNKWGQFCGKKTYKRRIKTSEIYRLFWEGKI